MTTTTEMLYHSFDTENSSATTSSSTASNSSGVSQSPKAEEEVEGQFTTLFCRALYDYEAQDASALSFRRNDIIEVLTQQPSGWWDGLLGEERGWFPSNYVTIISDEEAEAAFSGSEFSTVDIPGQIVQQESGTVNMSRTLMRGTQAENEEWLDNELSHRNGAQSTAKATPSTSNTAQPSDFWMPEVTADNQIWYVNERTGQRSRDLPLESEDDTSDGDFAGLTSQSSSRSATSVGLAFGLNGSSDASVNVQPKSNNDAPPTSRTPEPWVRKLSDDGSSYYYYNKVDGMTQWIRPNTSNGSASAPNTMKTYLEAQSRPMDNSRLSVYSDSSDIQPFDHLQPLRPRRNEKLHMQNDSLHTIPGQSAIMELTSAERIAKSLQQALEPPPPEMVTDLSAVTKGAIQAVVDNIQRSGLMRQPEEHQKLDDLVSSVVLAVRNLLYVSAAPTGHIPSTVLPRDGRDTKSHSTQQSPLKPAQRKVTATLSRLVLSARAMQYDSGSQLADTLNRIEADAEELERAVLSFVLEVQRTQHKAAPDSPEAKPHNKRLQGVFTTANLGLGLVGAGTAGTWKGLGWVSLEDGTGVPRKALGTEVVSEIATHISLLQDTLVTLSQALRMSNDNAIEQVRQKVQEAVTQMSAFLSLVADIHVARHVDIDGIRPGDIAVNDQYSQSVENARRLVRTLETILQALYDDSAALLLTTQGLHDNDTTQPRGERESSYDLLDKLSASLSSNLSRSRQTIEAILSVGHEQADMAQGDYNGSIEWRMSRLSVIHNQFGGAVRTPFKSDADVYDSENEGLVDLEVAFNRPGLRKQPSAPDSSFDSYSTLANGNSYDRSASTPARESESTLDNTLVSPSTSDIPDYIGNDNSPLFDDDLDAKAKAPPRPSGSKKLERWLGHEYADKVAADSRPWYLRPNYSPSDIIIEADGSVRGGTVSALVERLTAHEHLADRTYTEAFLMTFKSFTTLDELVNLLISRFRIQPPESLTPSEREEWGKQKQNIIQIRVINTFKSMIQGEDILEKEDGVTLEKIKDFVSSEDVVGFAAAKQLLNLIERAQRGGDSLKTLVNTNLGPPPAPIVPKTSKKLRLVDIEPLELARQLTIMESQLYQRIKPMECLQRSREQKTENIDNITVVIQTSNRIADWVADLVLSKEDSRKRAQIVKHLISVADRCRTLNNFSSMIAITSGLNTPPIRRLKRTWEQVNQRFMAQFGACEMTIDSNKNFTKYRQLMASVTPPCVPFIGVFLSTLQFIQDGNPDILLGGLVNFRKRQKASEVISDIKRWQTQPFNFQPLPSVLSYIEESLNQFSDTRASSEHFWSLSLEREPREREDEKMARLLQESGFL